MPPSATDRDLVVAFKSGDGQAYDEIYRRHSPKIRFVCSRRLGHTHDAEEAVQETFLRAYQALGRFNGQYKLGSWLNRIAINVCIDELRSRYRTEVVKPIGDHELGAEQGPDDMVAAQRPEVIAALGELKPMHADALKLRVVHGLSHEELAEQLSISPNQVKSLLHRARLAFKRVMNEASGFLLFPVAALRKGRKHGQAVAAGGTANAMGILTVAHTSWPMAERVVTGAIVAALAIGGASSGTLQEAPRAERDTRSAAVRREIRKPPRSVPVRTIAEQRPAAKTSKDDARLLINADVPELPVEVSTADEALTQVTERVDQELEQHTNEKRNDAGVKDPPPIDPEPIPASVDQVADEAKEKASDTGGGVLGDS